MNNNLFYLLTLCSFFSFSQEVKHTNIIGTWELIETINTHKINIGELIIHGNEQEKKEFDSIQNILEKKEKEDPRITKWHFIIEEKFLYEYRFEYGTKFKSKIINNTIYKFNKPFYKVVSLKNDTLKLKEYKKNTISVFKKVKTDLSDFKILSEY
ncbi:hypothetical protein [Aquimarina rhabdastrellae]